MQPHLLLSAQLISTWYLYEWWQISVVFLCLATPKFKCITPKCSWLSSAGCPLTSEVKDISNFHVFFVVVSFNSKYNLISPLIDISDLLLLVQFIRCLFKKIQVIWLLWQMFVYIVHFTFRFSIYHKLFLRFNFNVLAAYTHGCSIINWSIINFINNPNKLSHKYQIYLLS